MLKTMKASEKPSEIFARMPAVLKQEDTASQLTPLEIPSRPQTLVETPTSQALAAQKENPQFIPETLIQEIPPTTQIPHTITQSPTETPEGRGVETQAREGEVGDDAPSIEAGEGEERTMAEEEEGRKGEEVESDGNRGSEGEEAKGGEDDENEVSEKVDEGSGGEGEEGEVTERESEAIEEIDEEGTERELLEDVEEKDEEEQDVGCLNAKEKVEKEVVDVDKLPSDDKGTSPDERTTRRHSLRVKNAKEAPPASQLQRLRLRDEDGSEDDVSQVQEIPAGTEDVSP